MSLSDPSSAPVQPKDDGAPWERIVIWIPKAWKQELQDGAKRQGISMADLARMALRHFLWGRFE